MEIKSRHIVAVGSDRITFLVYGIIGVDVNGHYLAQDVEYAQRSYKEVMLRINSDGGSVAQTLSIIGAMLASSSKMLVNVDGVAASAAALFLAAADHVTMNDYARIMWHAPYMRDEDWNRVDAADERQARMVENYRGMMVSLLSKRGKTAEEVDALLNADTWFTADEALLSGLIDETITTKRKDLAAMAPLELVAKLISDNSKTEKPMKEVLAKLGLPETGDEQAVLAAIAKRDTELADRYIALGEKSGLVTEKNKEKMKQLAAANLDLFIGLVDDAMEAVATAAPAVAAGAVKPEEQARVSELIATAIAKSLGEKPKAEKTYDWYQKNDPAALNAIRLKEPEKYTALLDEYEASI